VRDALDPRFNVRTRTVVGGPAPKLVKAGVVKRRKGLAADRAAVARIERRIARAASDLVARSEAFAAGR